MIITTLLLIIIVGFLYGYFRCDVMSIFVGWSDLKILNFDLGISYSSSVFTDEDSGELTCIDNMNVGFFLFTIIFEFVYEK